MPCGNHRRWLPAIGGLFALSAGVALVAGGLSVTATRAAATSGSSFGGPQYPVAPYTNATYVTTAKHGTGSFVDQPWRGWLQTVPAQQMLDGIGVVYDPPPHADNNALIAALAADGVKTIRIEVGWNHMTANNDALDPSEASLLASVFGACHRYGIVPHVLLNANDGDPEPGAPPVFRTVGAPASAGATSLKLTSTAGLVAGHSGLSDLSGEAPKAAGILLTALAADGTATLSKPLPAALASGQKVKVSTLRYLPLYPVGTPEFDATVAGWITYATVVTRAVVAAGISDFNVELWNELSFGSRFLDIDNYYATPLFPKTNKGFKHGGRDWTLAARTAAALHQQYGNHVTVIWGFSNTTFEGTPIAQLPPGIDGQSYHPYHNKLLTLAANLKHLHQSFSQALPDGPASDTLVAIPESVFATDIKVESITANLLPPSVRAKQHPPGATNFKQYITENGIAPGASGVKDPKADALVKTKMELRNYAFWLNKGITSIDLYDLYSSKATGYGFLQDSNTKKSEELESLANYTRAFAGSTSLANPRQLTVGVSAVGPQYMVDPGVAHPLWYRNLCAVLPFQVSANRFVIAVYTMSYNIFRALPGGGTLNYQVTIGSLDPAHARVSYYDPITNKTITAPVLARGNGSVTVGLATTDYPRLLTITD